MLFSNKKLFTFFWRTKLGSVCIPNYIRFMRHFPSLASKKFWLLLYSLKLQKPMSWKKLSANFWFPLYSLKFENILFSIYLLTLKTFASLCISFAWLCIHKTMQMFALYNLPLYSHKFHNTFDWTSFYDVSFALYLYY